MKGLIAVRAEVVVVVVGGEVVGVVVVVGGGEVGVVMG